MKSFQTGISPVRFVTFLMLATLAFSAFLADAPSAEARAGGGRSMGRGGSSFGGGRRAAPPPMHRSAPPQQHNPSAAPAPAQQPAQQSPPPPQQKPARGGFMRGLAGGIAGGFLGSMLFNSMGHGSPMGSGSGGSGIGLFDVLLLAGIAFLGYRWWRSRQQETIMTPSYGGGAGHTGTPVVYAERESTSYQEPLVPASLRVESDLDSEAAGDIFFRVQGAWTRRDLSPVADLIEGDLFATLNLDVTRLKDERHINRLENITIRSMELRDAWTELGADLATMRVLASLLDYTVDETTGAVIDGSDTIPVKFQEDWTFRRENAGGKWKLAGIAQV